MHNKKQYAMPLLFKGIAMLMIACGIFSCLNSEAREKKNIIWIIGDDVGDELGFMGHDQVKSPHLDQFAERGVLFTNAHCQSPLCNPSRTSFLSGLRPETHRIMDNRQAPYSFKADIKFYQYYFQDADYYNIVIGKLAQNRFYQYNSQGFDEVHGLSPGKNQDALENTNPVQIGKMYAVEDSVEYLIPDAMMKQRAVEFLKNQSSNKKPFNLYVGFQIPHTWRYIPQRFYDLYNIDEIKIPPEPTPEQRKELSKLFGIQDEEPWTEEDKEEIRHELWGHYAATTYMDHLTGAILDEITRQKLWDNTIVVFTVDHGMLSPNNWHPGKGNIRREGTRVPLIIWDKNTMANGQTCDKAVELIDIVPTLLDLCNLPQPELDGKSLRPLLNDPSNPDINPYAQSTFMRGETLGKSITKGHFQYVSWENFPEELYNTEQDPMEYENLANDPQYADILNELKNNIINSDKELHREISHKPAVAINNLEDGADFSSGQEIKVEYIALDQDDDLKVVELYVDDTKVESSQSQSSHQNLQHFDLKKLEPGNHQIEIRARDQQSNKNAATVNIAVK